MKAYATMSSNRSVKTLCILTFHLSVVLQLTYSFSPTIQLSALVRRRTLQTTSATSTSHDFAAADTSASHDGALSKIAKQKKRKKTSHTKWVACSSTTEVTRAIEMYAKEGDVVAELGSQLRESSTALCEVIGPDGKAVLVDIERKFPNEKKGQLRTRAMRREGDEVEFYTDRATFVETRGFEFWRDALFFQTTSTERPQYNVLVVDVSTVAGNDLDLTCISLVKEFLALNHGGFDDKDGDEECRAVIVKSGSLHNMARRLYHAQRIISGAQSIDDRYKYTQRHSSIVGAVGVKQYRETIPFVVREGDVCVEVGCHLGTTTTLIHEAAAANRESGDHSIDNINGNFAGNKIDNRGCLGVDVGSSIIKSARKKYPQLSFEVGDGFKTGSLARMKEKHFGNNTENTNYDVVYVDIGGLSGSEGLLEAVSLLSSISNSLEPRCIVIKSLCIRRLASCLVPFSEVWRKDNNML